MTAIFTTTSTITGLCCIQTKNSPWEFTKSVLWNHIQWHLTYQNEVLIKLLIEYSFIWFSSRTWRKYKDHIRTLFKITVARRTGEMTQCLRALAAIPMDPGLLPNNHMVICKLPWIQFQRIQRFLRTLKDTRHVSDTKQRGKLYIQK